MANTYSTSEGIRLTTAQIDVKIRYAKAIKLDQQLQEYNYNFCTICKRNDCKPLDVSHNISVKEAKESGRSELCWDLDNMEIIGRRHHQEKDGLNLQWK